MRVRSLKLFTWMERYINVDKKQKNVLQGSHIARALGAKSKARGVMRGMRSPVQKTVKMPMPSNRHNEHR